MPDEEMVEQLAESREEAEAKTRNDVQEIVEESDLSETAKAKIFEAFGIQ